MTAIDKYRAALDASSTGCGKTLVAAQIAFEYDFPTLVIAPKSAIPMWEAELEDRGVSEWYVLNYEKIRTGKTEWGEWVGPKGNIWRWNVPADTFMIWDECQKGKGMNSQNARMFWSAKPYRNLCLSATAAKDPTEMKALGYLLGLHQLRNFWGWALKNGCVPGTFGGLDFEGTPEQIDALHHAIFPLHGSRLTRDDMKEHFKDTQIILDPIDFGPEIQAVYEEMEKELAVVETARKGDPRSAQAQELLIRLRARQKVELLKVPYMLDRIENDLEEGLSVAVFVNFTATVDALRSRLEVPSGVVTGAHPDRQKWIDDFQNDRIRVIINNVQVGGVNISLHDLNGVYPRTAYISPSDNEKDVLQCVGRIDRAGNQSETQQHVLFAANTVEVAVKDNCVKKMKQIDIFNRGLDEHDKKWDDFLTT